VTPRASREAFGPGTSGHFAARLTAPPVEGAANVALVAKSFGVAKREVTIVAGETSRLKRLDIIGDAAALEARAASLYGVEP
jgi:uncharacterized protein YggU (UPF0235/DUF167 family)